MGCVVHILPGDLHSPDRGLGTHGDKTLGVALGDKVMLFKAASEERC